MEAGGEHWKIDIRHLAPSTIESQKLFIRRLRELGLENDILESLCHIDELPSCEVYHARIIAVYPNEDNDVKLRSIDPHYHKDFAHTLENVYTVLIPLQLPESERGELLLEGQASNGGVVRATYRYQETAAIAFNGGVRHATNHNIGASGQPRLMLCVHAGTVPSTAKKDMYDILGGDITFVTDKLESLKSQTAFNQFRKEVMYRRRLPLSPSSSKLDSSSIDQSSVDTNQYPERRRKSNAFTKIDGILNDKRPKKESRKKLFGRKK